MTRLQIAGEIVRASNNFYLDAAGGSYNDCMTVNKFGAAPDGVQTTATDIWSRADSAATQQVWLAPTAARVHAIVSNSVADTGYNVRVYGLTSWSSKETSELVALDGTNPVNTINSYVIIHRMKIIPTAAKVTNAGVITATAATDGTITALILTGDGQTEMAIYGVPSVQTVFITRWSASINKATGAAAWCDFQLRVNENPNVQTTGYLRKNDISLISTASSGVDKVFQLPIKVSGPCVIKVQATASVNDMDAKSAFDLLLIDN
jgi:hypothetical protein